MEKRRGGEEKGEWERRSRERRGRRERREEGKKGRYETGKEREGEKIRIKREWRISEREDAR